MFYKGGVVNTDIRIAISFKSHRKRKKLKMRLGAAGVLALIDLWSGVATSRPSGLLTGWDTEDIALEGDWEGDPQEFVDTILDIGFLEVTKNGDYAVHGWTEHQPWVVGADARSQKAKNAARARWAKQEDDGSNATKKPRAEQQECSEHASSITDTKFSTYAGPTLITIPLAKKGADFEVKQEDVEQWQDTFPGVDIIQALKRVRQWNIDNPKRRKTEKGIRKHISAWLDREQNKRPIITGRQKPSTPREQRLAERDALLDMIDDRGGSNVNVQTSAENGPNRIN